MNQTARGKELASLVSNKSADPESAPACYALLTCGLTDALLSVMLAQYLLHDKLTVCCLTG